MGWELHVSLAPDPGQPLYRRVVAAITGDIRSGRLRAGAELPGTRRLAVQLGVHRNTTIAAYRELASAGWIDTRPGRGTFVLGVADAGPIAVPTARVATPTRPREILALGHLPAPAEAPQVALARAYRRALRHGGARVLDYAERGDSAVTLGHPRLRAALAELSTRARGMAIGADDVLVTAGAQMALFLATRALLGAGDGAAEGSRGVIAVEARGYSPVWETFRSAGATPVPIPLDGDGLCVDTLCRVAAQRHIRAVYVTPRHQHPTGVVMSPSRRAALVAFAAASGATILEDDYDNDFEYGEDPVLPLAATHPHRAVLYVGSLAKLLAPGVRVGFVVAPPPLLRRMAEVRASIDRQGDHALECAVAELLDDGELRRHQQRMRVVCRARRDALVSALASELGDVVRFDRPARGTAIWAAVRPDIDVDSWHVRALAAGVSFVPERAFDFDAAPSRHARFGFASLDAARRVEAVGRLRRALPEGPRVRRPVPAKIVEADLRDLAPPP
ncbi:MAG: PLP-dependent aminotransferase family protein [Myxococcales bacterium]|nr:PLP-dependent aminotransferase family protein [Myxococcales bacterium]